MEVFMGLNISMQMTMIMYHLTLPPELDGGLFEDVSSFLSLDVPYEVQQTTVEFISKLHIVIDKFTPLQTQPILSNIRTHYNIDTKQHVILSIGIVDMDWYRNEYLTTPEVAEGFAAFRAWLAAYNMTLEEIRSNVVEVEFYPSSCVFLGIPVNYPELKYLYDTGSIFTESP
jgi:hypothetical protein